MPQAAVPIAAEAAVATTLTAAEIAAAQAAAAQLAAAELAAAQAVAATNSSVLSTIAATPVSSAAGATTAAGAGTGAGGAGGISSLVNTTGGPTTFEQVFSQGQNIAEGSTELGKLASSGNGLGVETLAKEVGATSAFNTPASTLTQYGAGAPVSTPLTSATPFNPAAPMANPTYAQPSGLQGLQTNLSGPLGSNLPPPSVSQVVTSAGTGAPPETDILKQMINPNGAERFAGTQNLIENPASVPSDMYTKESLRVPLDEQLGRMPTEAIPNTTIPAQAATAAAPEAGGLQGLYNDFKAMSLPNKLLTGMLASSAYQMLNPPKPYEPKKYKPTFKPGLYTGYQPVQPTPYTPQYAHGGLADLGGYSDGGRMLKGPGDGMSDDIPATIANKQPARLANEEFVVPADVVSHLGNGSSEAGAKVLYKMMDRVRRARTGSKKQGKQINPEKYLA